MAKPSIDLSATLRDAALRLQRENAARLLAGQSVSGAPLAPKKDGGRPGVESGEMLAELSHPANVVATKTRATIGVSDEVSVRLATFVKGNEHQPPRPFLGASLAAMTKAAEGVAKTARDQFVQALSRRGRS